MKQVLIFISVFLLITVCSVLTAFCGGLQFGTSDFGWLVGGGMFIGMVAGALVATIPWLV